MRAAVIDRYGAPDVVRVAEVDPPAPGPGEVLVRVRAASVTSGDARIRAARFPRGFTVPARLVLGVLGPRRRILGGTFSGVVEQAGSKVTDLAAGDQVCGMTGGRLGTHAELVAVPGGRVVPKPPEVTHDAAAGVLFGGTTALYFLRDQAVVTPGARVLVNGASGAVGTNAVQLAKHFGGTVTGVTSAANAALVTALGADRIIDHTSMSLTEVSDRFDVVVDTVGNLDATSGRRLLTEDGVLVLGVAGLWETVRARGRVKAGPAPERAEDFEFLLQLVARDELAVVIDEVVSLEEIARAYERVDSGHKVGNLIVRP